VRREWKRKVEEGVAEKRREGSGGEKKRREWRREEEKGVEEKRCEKGREWWRMR
jgi:hypothetical protein